MIYFRQNDIMDKMSFYQRRRPPYGQPSGSHSINMPWVIPPWLALVEFLGLTAKEYNKHNNDKATMSTMTATTATATAAMATTRMAAMMATMMKVMWTAMVAATMTAAAVLVRQRWRR
jgi:hypothetical protein